MSQIESSSSLNRIGADAQPRIAGNASEETQASQPEGCPLPGNVSEGRSGAPDRPDARPGRTSVRPTAAEGRDKAPECPAASSVPSAGKPAEHYLGIDIGSISTKGVIIGPDRSIIARSYLWTEGNPVEAAKRVVAELRQQIDPAQVRVTGAGTTGSARRLVGAMLGASVIKNEITAHAVGTTFLHPDVRTILEIGGQDSKIILVSDGIAVNYAMNTLCAAGTGSFLSSQAHRLGVEVEEFGKIALTSKRPASIAARCTVFAESDLVHKIQVGYAREDIIAGLCNAVASNYLNNVGKGKKILAPVVFQGGVSKNEGVVRAFEEQLGLPVAVDPDGHLMGAFGAALLAADAGPSRATGEGPFATGAFDFDAALDFEFSTREIVCGKCANHCEVICVRRDGKIIDSWGNRCERGAVKTD